MHAPEPLSARLLAHADGLRTIAHAVAAHDQALASRIISHAAQAALMHLGAQTLERDLARAECTVAPLPPSPPCATGLAAVEQRHRRARIIADILGPVLGKGSLGRGPRA